MAPDSLLRRWLWAATTLLKHGRPDVVVSFLGGIGDDLLCTTPIHEWLQRGAKRIWFVSRHPSLHRFDSRVHVLPENPAFFALARRLKCEPRFLSYSNYDATTDRDTPLHRHLLAEMCSRAGLTGRVELRPRLALTPGETARAASGAGSLIVQASGLDAAVPMRNKQWPALRMQAVVDHFAGRIPVVQIGSLQDPALAGAQDLRGKTTMRETAALLARARLFVGVAGFPMHLARAVDCPAVIVYGGREPPGLTGYACNQNISGTPECSPCWQRNRCDFDHICMQAIDAGQAVAAIDRALSLPRAPLTVETVEL